MFVPPTFFDIQPHFVVHLVEDVELRGPIQARWLYFLERYMKDLKNFVWTYLEGSINEGDLAKEAFLFGKLLSWVNP